jgi:hypothetical protein
VATRVWGFVGVSDLKLELLYTALFARIPRRAGLLDFVKVVIQEPWHKELGAQSSIICRIIVSQTVTCDT